MPTTSESVLRRPKTNTIIGSNALSPLKVENVAALRAIVPATVEMADGQQVETASYATAGDNGGGLFVYNAASVATDNGGTIVAPTSGSGRWLRVYSGNISPLWFGAKRDGTTSDSAAFQAAIDCAGALGGGTVQAPAGTYKMTATLLINVNNVYLVGEGQFNTILTRSADYGDTVRFTGNDGTGTLLSNVGLMDLTLKVTALVTTGSQLKLNGILHGTFENLYIEQGFVAVTCLGLTGSTIHNLNVLINTFYSGSAVGRRCMYISDAAATYAHRSCGDLFISDVNLRADAAADISCLMESADGVWFSNCHIGGAVTANLEMSNIASSSLAVVWFNNVMFDSTSTLFNVLFLGGINRGRFIQFCNCEMAGNYNAQYGVFFEAYTQFSQVRFEACKIFQHLYAGVQLRSTGTYRIDFSDCDIFGNNTSNTNGISGFIAEANVGSFSIDGGAIGGTEGSTTYQRWGIDIVAGTGDDINISNVDLSYNTTAGMRSAATGNNVHFTNNFAEGANEVGAASTITLPLCGDLVTVLGNTGIDTITALGVNARVTLLFTDSPTINDGTGNLKLAGNFGATPNATLSLVCDGTNWIETGRSTN